MACPTCGGTARTVTETDQVICTEVRVVPGYWTGAPGLIDPFAGPGRIWVEATSLSCHTSYWVPDDRLSAEEILQRQLKAEAAELAKAERAERNAEIKRDHEVWETSVEAILAQGGSDAERTVLVVATFTRVQALSYAPWEEFDVDWPMIRRFLPDLTASFPRPPSGEHGRHTNLRSFWNHDDVQEWFLANVVARPTHEELMVRSRGIFGEKRKPTPGWLFKNGSTLHHPKYDHPWDLAILEDGRRDYLGSKYSLQPGDPGEGFNARALVKMARLAAISLPPRPQVPEQSA